MKRMIGFLLAASILLIGSYAFASDENYEKAVKYYFRQNYKQAVVYFEKYVEKNPDAAAYYMLGYSCYEIGDFEKSRKYFNEAYLIDPNISTKVGSEGVPKEP